MICKMNAYVQEVPTAGGGTVQIISGFGECTRDPEATKAAVADLLVNSPEFAKCQNQQAKITAQRKIATESFELKERAIADRDAKNEAVHAAAYHAALSAVCVLSKELEPLADDYEAVRNRLYMENPVYFPCGPGHHCLADGEYETLKAKFDALGEHERLTLSGEVIADNRGVEYRRKDGGKWIQGKIENIGEKLPAKAVIADKLTPEQQQEISAQEEAERIAAMSAEDKAQAKQAALDALADEADRLDRRAKIQGKEFDPVAYYNERTGAIETKYA